MHELSASTKGITLQKLYGNIPTDSQGMISVIDILWVSYVLSVVWKVGHHE